VRKNEKEADLRPVAPSKIPVGAFRVDVEKAINRALNGVQQMDQWTPTVNPMNNLSLLLHPQEFYD